MLEETNLGRLFQVIRHSRVRGEWNSVRFLCRLSVQEAAGEHGALCLTKTSPCRVCCEHAQPLLLNTTFTSDIEKKKTLSRVQD